MTKWENLEEYKGCQIDHRPGMSRRGFSVRIPKELGSHRGGWQVHDSADACKKNIDRRIKMYGEPKSYTYGE